MNSCCQKHVETSKPVVKKKDFFKEIQNCTSCQKKITITFQEISYKNGASDFEVIDADYED